MPRRPSPLTKFLSVGTPLLCQTVCQMCFKTMQEAAAKPVLPAKARLLVGDAVVGCRTEIGIAESRRHMRPDISIFQSEQGEGCDFRVHRPSENPTVPKDTFDVADAAAVPGLVDLKADVPAVSLTFQFFADGHPAVSVAVFDLMSQLDCHHVSMALDGLNPEFFDVRCGTGSENAIIIGRQHYRIVGDEVCKLVQSVD